MVREIARRLGVPADDLLRSTSPRAGLAPSDEARVDVNFARMALANSNPAEAVRIIDAPRPRRRWTT